MLKAARRQRVVLPYRPGRCPHHARDFGFFYRLRVADNSPQIRLPKRNRDANTLEVFITATSTGWRCYRDEDRTRELHCINCLPAQQRECAMWATARAGHLWSRRLLMHTRWSRFASETPKVVLDTQRQLLLLCLRLLRVYRIPKEQVLREGAALARRGRRQA